MTAMSHRSRQKTAIDHFPRFAANYFPDLRLERAFLNPELVSFRTSDGLSCTKNLTKPKVDAVLTAPFSFKKLPTEMQICSRLFTK
jgi:hypothetical protein